MPGNIRAVIFDLGGVLAGFRSAVSLPQGIFSKKLELDWRNPRVGELLKELELGSVSPKEFYQRALSFAKQHYSYSEFVNAWNDMFYFSKAMHAQIIALKRAGYKIGIVSNIDPWHYEVISDYYGLQRLANSIAASFAVHSRKPSREIFEAVLRGLKEKPENCVYIDDVRAHVDKASKLGFNAIRFESPKQLQRELARHSIFANSHRGNASSSKKKTKKQTTAETL